MQISVLQSQNSEHVIGLGLQLEVVARTCALIAFGAISVIPISHLAKA